MPQFSYTARDAKGARVEGVLEAFDTLTAADELARQGITPVDIRPFSAPVAASSRRLSLRLGRERVTDVDVMMFSRQMHTLLRAGVPIMAALIGLQRSSANEAFAAVVGGLRESLDAGRDLSASLAQYPQVFSYFYVNMVRIGEMTGRLDEIFLRMFQHLEFEKFMRDQVKSALRYPSFVIVTMAVALVVVNLFVIPAFAKVYKSFNADLPVMTQVLIAFSRFMTAAWPGLLAAAVAAVFAFRRWVRTEAGRMLWDRYKLKFPIAGRIVLKATLARFARSLALALRSGVPIIGALTAVAQTVENAFIARKVEEMRAGVERGESVLRTATVAGVFTPIVLQMVAVGEESGALDSLLQEVAEMYQREVEYDLKSLSAQIEPILVVCLGILVLILALGVFLPIWDLGRTMIK